MRKGIWGFALVAIVLLMASCSSESEYANAIPKDAAMVMSFDFKTMAEKSGINGKGGEKVVAKLTDALKSGLEGEAYKTAEKIIQNPSESGLSFTDKVSIHAGLVGIQLEHAAHIAQPCPGMHIPETERYLLVGNDR